MKYTCLPVLCLIAAVFSQKNVQKDILKVKRPMQEHDFNSDNVCPNTNTWFVQERNGSCHCGSDLDGVVQCDSETKEVEVLDCHCLTNDYTEGNTNVPVAGSCIFNCNNISKFDSGQIYHAAPSNCKDMNRKGTLCGRCLDGYALSAYTYIFKCMRCDSEIQNWWLYITYAFLPLTVFIVIILVFRINVVSPKLYLFVLASQILSSPLQIRLLLISPYKIHEYLKTTVYFIVNVYGIWNLDFFRVGVLPPVCINVIPLHTLTLDYLVAIYPMMVMGVAYILVELYGCGFRPVLFLWRPFHRILARFRRHWGIETSIMDALVTFFVLSNVKLFSVSFDLLVPTRLFTPNGEYTWHLYYDPSIKYFGTDHLPYVLLATAVLTVFILFPLSLLLCYQFTVFRKCLRKCQLSGPTLDMYVHSFQQYYKDGSNGTRDCRWFSGFFLIVKITLFLIYASSLAEISYVFFIFASIMAAVIVLILQPFKEAYDIYNMLTLQLLLWAALFFAFLVGENFTTIFSAGLHGHYISCCVLGLVPLIYIMGVVVHHFYKRCCYTRLNKAFGTVALSSLPHRVLHSDQYQNTCGFVPVSSHATQ